MLNKKVLALGIIVFLFIQMNFIIFTSIIPLYDNTLKQNLYGNPLPEIREANIIENPLAVYANFNPDFAPLQIVTFVGLNDPNIDADFTYLASIPIALYNENSVLKVSPLLFDELTLADQNFLVDWKNYCKLFDSWDGIKNVVYIGNVSSSTMNQVEDILNPEMLRNPSIPAALRERVQIGGTNTFDIVAEIAKYFWYRPETVIVAPIAEDFAAPQSTVENYTGTLSDIQWINKTGEINQTNLMDSWTNSDLMVDSGALFVQINTVNEIAIELFGNYSESTPWMYDTNRFTKNKWVFFPNISYPAAMTDWGLRVRNATDITGAIPYDLAFFNLTYDIYPFEIANSESEYQFTLDWNDSTADLKFWVLDPTNQLVAGSSRSLFEAGKINASSTILYPTEGNWSVVVTRTSGSDPVSYNLTINKTEFSTYKRQSIESAANAAILASLLNKPLLYVTNTTVPNETKQALSVLDVSSVIRVDPFNLMSEDVSRELNTTGEVTNIVNLTSRTLLYEYISNISQQPDLVFSSVNEGYFAPASLIAAFHGAPLISTINEGYNLHAGALKNYAMENWIGFQNPGNSGLLNQSIPRYEDMKELADGFYSWLGTLNLDNANNMTILVISSLSELSPFFDRAIFGKALVGRFAAVNTPDLAVSICRSILYPALGYADLTYGYQSRNKIIGPEGNSTITPTQVIASGITGDHTNCLVNDNTYHSYYNGTGGQIIMPYYVNLSNAQIVYNNISQVVITIDGHIGYSNASIQLAGWGVWNWTAASILVVNGEFLNATTDQSVSMTIDSQNKTDLIHPSNSRIEIFVLVNTTGPLVATSIDFIEFNVTYQHIYNVPKMLSSSITYWHNFNFQGTEYNYSSAIPSLFSQNGYLVVNATGYQTIYSELTDGCKFWYYTGNTTLDVSEDWSMLFTQNNYWRAYGDYNDNQGSSPDNPDADEDHYVTANLTLGKWQTISEILTPLQSLPSTMMLLQTSYGAKTLFPEYLMAQGATSVVANLKESTVGYSEHLAYLFTINLINNGSLGEAFYDALKQTSHIYSENHEGNVIGIYPFSNYTEESQAFILFGDPKLTLIGDAFNLVRPSNYRPLIHELAPYTFRTTSALIWANITDLDSIINQDVRVEFNITGTDWPEFETYKIANYEINENRFKGYTSFFNPAKIPYESLAEKTITWKIFDEVNQIELTLPILLRSNPASVAYKSIKLNDTGSYNDLSQSHNTLGRVNESLLVYVQAVDIDHDPNTPDDEEFNVTLVLQNIDDSSMIFYPMDFLVDSTPDDALSEWNCTYHFDAFDSTGRYWIYVRITDGDNETSIIRLNPESEKILYVKNWAPEPSSPQFVVTNGTGATNQIFRVNETLEVFGAVFDVDGNQTRVEQVELCFYHSVYDQWINISMVDDNWDNNWTVTNRFTEWNTSGTWDILLQVTDKDNYTVLLDPKVNISVANHLPDTPFNVTILDFNATEINSVLRNNTLQFTGNATDFDIANRTADLSLFACLKDPAGHVRYQYLMVYDNNTDLWWYNFTVQSTDPIGNWTYYVSAVDEAGGRTNSSGTSLMVLNNIPIIRTVAILPADSKLYIGEPLSFSGTVVDIEQLANITVFIQDETGTKINLTTSVTGQEKMFVITFQEADYVALKTSGVWNITMRLVDADGAATTQFNFGVQNNSIIITVYPRSEDTPTRIPFEIIIAIAIIVTVVMATYLIYRTRKQEATVVPAARVKQIIKKLSKERDEKEETERADLQARIKSIEIKPKTKVEIVPGELKAIAYEEQEKLNKEMRMHVKNAQELLDQTQFEAAAAAYHDASVIASKLGKNEIAKVYSTRSEEILERKAELKKKAKEEAKEEKRQIKELKKRKLGRTEIETIKAEIGEIMRSARKALRNNDTISAAKYYREVAERYRKIGDDERAVDFEEKANEL